jgi:hypothetical protein
MAMTESQIKVIIAAELKKQGFDKAQKATGALDKTFKKLAATIAATFGAQQIIAFGKASVKAFADDEKAARRLTGTLNNMGLAFEDPRVKKFISDLEATSGVLDDKLRPAMQAFLTQTGSVKKSQELLTLAIDMSAQSGYDLETVASDLSRAYVGNTKGLAKYNLGLSRTELSSKSFAEVQVLLNKQFSGANQAYLETYSGQVSLLNVAYANMQETIGKSLVEAFSRLAGKDGIGSATKAMEDFGVAISDTITGISILIEKIKSLPLASPIISALANMSNFGILGVIQALGERERTAPKPMMNRAMSVSGASDLYTKQERDRIKREKDAEKRAKALAALQKKAELERIKREREAQQLKRAGSIFDMENIQIVAALQGKIDGEQRLRLVALLALNNDIADAAEKASTAVLALNAPALANLGVIMQTGDNITDVIGKLISAQAKVALIDMGITNIPKAKNPFEDWDSILKKIIFDLDAINAKIKGMPVLGTPTGTTTTTKTPSGTTTTTTTIGGGTGGTGGGTTVTNPSVSNLGKRVGDTLDALDLLNLYGNGASSGNMGSNPAITNLSKRVGDILDTTDAALFTTLASSSVSGGANPALTNLMKRTGDYSVDSSPTVSVIVQGSVITEQDLTATILDNLYDYQRAGQGIVLSSVSI